MSLFPENDPCFQSYKFPFFDCSVDASEKRSGSEELKLALRRLSLRRQNCLSERLFFEGERERRNREPADSGDYSNRLVHSESIMSLGAWASRPYLPDKLQIVKPLEGDRNTQNVYPKTFLHYRSRPRPPTMMLFNSLWGLMHPRKHSYFRESRSWVHLH